MDFNMKLSVRTWRQALIVVAALAFGFLSAGRYQRSILRAREGVRKQDMDGAPVLGDPVLSPNLSVFRITGATSSSAQAGGKAMTYDSK